PTALPTLSLHDALPISVFRAIPHKIKPLDELGMPESVTRFAHLPRGLVLVTGPTGSGKTTTLASVLDLANRSRSSHIITIEDPRSEEHTSELQSQSNLV